MIQPNKRRGDPMWSPSGRRTIDGRPHGAAPTLSRVADNVGRNGAVVDAASTDPSVQGVRRFTELLAAEPRVSATAVQTVGSKGYDGFVVALVVADP